MTKTHWRKVQLGDYLAAEELDDGKGGFQTLEVTIKGVKQGKVQNHDGRVDDKPIIYFKEFDRGMVLNVTNSEALAKALKTPYLEDWVGKKAYLGVDIVKAFGDTVPALRFKDFAPKPKQQSKIKCKDCKKLIKGEKGATADQIAKATKSKYGDELCVSCAAKRKDKGTEAGSEVDPETGLFEGFDPDEEVKKIAGTNDK